METMRALSEPTGLKALSAELITEHELLHSTRQKIEELAWSFGGVLLRSVVYGQFLMMITMLPVAGIIAHHREMFHEEHAWIQCIALSYALGVALSLPIEWYFRNADRDDSDC